MKRDTRRIALGEITFLPAFAFGFGFVPPWLMSAKKEFSSSLAGQERHMVFVAHSLRIHKVETGGWQVFGASQDCMAKLLLLKKGQVSERFKQAEETPTKLSVPHPRSVLFCFLCRMAGKPVKLPH